MNAANGNTALAVVEPAQATRTFEPQSIDQAYDLAKLLMASRMLPKHVQSPEAAFAIIASGRELGMTALQSLRSIYFFEGKITLSADLVLALTKRYPECEYFRLVKSDETIATYETKRRGEPSPTTMSFTIQEAQQAGVMGKDNWKKYPAAMLRARCITALARAVYPDAMMAVYDPDELGQTPTPVQVERVANHDPQTGEVIEAKPAVDPEEQKRIGERMLTAIGACEKQSELANVARSIAVHSKNGALTPQQCDVLRTAWEERRTALKQSEKAQAVRLELAQTDTPGNDGEEWAEGRT